MNTPRDALAGASSASQAQNDEDTRHPYWRRNRQALPLAAMLASMGFAVSFPFLPVMMQSLGVHDHLETWVGSMMLLFYVISFASGPVWGGIADFYGRKIMILRAMLGMGLLMAVVPFAPTPLWFVFLFSLVGFFNGFSPASQALLVANTPTSYIGSTLARLQTGMLLGQTMGPALATVAVALVSRPHWLFWFSGCLLLLGGTITALYVHEVKSLASGKWKLDWIGSLHELVKVPRIGMLYVLSFIFAMLSNGNITILSVYVLQLLGEDPLATGSGTFWVGAVAMSLAISSVLPLVLWGKLLDRVDPARVLVFCTAAAAITQIPLVFLETPLQLILTRIAFGLGAAMMLQAIIRLLKSYAPQGMDARAISYCTSFQFIAVGLAPFIAGIIGPVFGLRSYFALTVVLSLVALMLWLRAMRRPMPAS